jgi:hypothetical protein
MAMRTFLLWLLLAGTALGQAFSLHDPAFIGAATRPVVAAGGSAFVTDSMTGSDSTDLTAHTGETGATWAKVTGITGIIKITSNRCKGDSGGASLYYASGTPASANYEVEADLYVVSEIDEVGVCGRLSTGAHTCYRAWYDHTTGDGYKFGRV